MKRVMRWTFRLLLLAVVLALGGIGAWMLIVPGIVERRVLASLADVGLGGSSLRAEFIGLHHATLSNVSIGQDDRLLIQNISVSYAPQAISRGRVQSIRIVGAQLRATLRDGVFDFGQLGAIHGSGGGGEPDLPLEQLDLIASKFVLELPTRTLVFPVEGSVVRRGPQIAAVELTAIMGDRRIHVSGEVNLAGGRITAGDLKLAASAPHITPIPGVVLGDVHADLHLMIDAGSDKASVVLKNGSRLAALSMSAVRPGMNLHTMADDESGLSLRVGEQPVELTLTRYVDASGAAGWTWLASVPEIVARAGTISGAASMLGLEIDRAKLTAKLAAVADANGLRIVLADPAHLQAATILMPIGTQGLRLDNTALQVNAADAKPLLLLRSGAKRLSQLAVHIVAERALQMTGAQAAATFDGMDTRIVFEWGDERKPRLDSMLKLTGGALSYAPSRLVARGVELAVPITLNAAALATGRLNIADIKLGDDQLPPLVGSASFTDGRGEFTAAWKFSDAIIARIAGQITPQRTQVTLKLPRTQIVDADLPGKLFAAMRGVEIDGHISVDGQFAIAQGRFEPSITLELHNVGVRAAKWQISAEELSGTVTLNGLVPLTTPGRQRLEARKLTVGKLAFDDGLLEFRIDDSRHAFIERIGFRFGTSGRFMAHAIAFDAERPELDTDIFLEDVNLGDWLTVITGEPISGTGRLYGRVPVSFRPAARQKLAFKPGFIFANPGPGTLKLGDKAKVTELLNKADPNFLKSPELAKIRVHAVDALTDFEYSLFRFEIVSDDGGQMMLKIAARGKGRNTAVPVEFTNLEVNIRGFEEAANELLFLKMTLDQTLDRTLDRFFDKIQDK